MDLLVFIFVITASLTAGGSGSPVPSKFQDAENTDDKILDDIIPDYLSRNALKNPASLWPDGKVLFKIDKQFDDARVRYIHRAMQAISTVSCIEFMEAPSNATTYLRIKVSPNGCEATVGYTKDTIRHIALALDKLDTGCFRIGTIIHELMHALGFVHQHSVPYRDKYVKIVRENIEEDAIPKFEKHDPALITDLGLPYDFDSVMHYPLDAFTKNGNLTIQPIADPGPVLVFGQRVRLSRLDIAKLNKLYKCCD